MKFDSSFYLIYQCNAQELIGILNTKLLNISLPIYNKPLLIGRNKVDCKYLYFQLNGVTSFDKKGEYFLIFPINKLCKNRFFSLQDNSLFLFQPPQEEFEMKKDIKLFSKLEDDLKFRLNEWVEETRHLDGIFKENWSDDAENMIEKDFTKKWLSFSSGDFKARYDLDISLIIGMMHKYKEEIPLELTKNNLSKLNYKDFRKEISKAKDFYGEIINDYKRFIKSTKPTSEDCFILIPDSYRSYFSKWINDKKLKFSFYSADSQSGLSEYLTDNFNEEHPKEIKLKKVRIFADNLALLSTLD